MKKNKRSLFISIYGILRKNWLIIIMQVKKEEIDEGD